MTALYRIFGSKMKFATTVSTNLHCQGKIIYMILIPNLHWNRFLNILHIFNAFLFNSYAVSCVPLVLPSSKNKVIEIRWETYNYGIFRVYEGPYSGKPPWSLGPPTVFINWHRCRGGTCNLGRRFHLFRSSESNIFQVQRVPGCGFGIQGRHLHHGKPFFKSRGRLDRAAGFRGRHFFTFPTGRLVAAELKRRDFPVAAPGVNGRWGTFGRWSEHF